MHNFEFIEERDCERKVPLRQGLHRCCIPQYEWHHMMPQSTNGLPYKLLAKAGMDIHDKKNGVLAPYIVHTNGDRGKEAAKKVRKWLYFKLAYTHERKITKKVLKEANDGNPVLPRDFPEFYAKFYNTKYWSGLSGPEQAKLDEGLLLNSSVYTPAELQDELVEIYEILRAHEIFFYDAAGVSAPAAGSRSWKWTRKAWSDYKTWGKYGKVRWAKHKEARKQPHLSWAAFKGSAW